MGSTIGLVCALLAAFWLGWGVATEREYGRQQKQRRVDLDAEVSETDLREWEREMGGWER